MRFVLVIGFALMSKVGAVVLAQGLTGVSIPNTEYREFTSQATRRPYAVFVALPDSYQSDPTKRYPVVYVTDAHFEFALTT